MTQHQEPQQSISSEHEAYIQALETRLVQVEARLATLQAKAKGRVHLDDGAQPNGTVSNGLQPERMAQVLGSIKDGLLAVDAQWRLVYLNHRALAVAGRSLADAIGQPLWDVFPALAGTFFESRYRQAMEQRRPDHFEARGARSDQWYDIHLYPTGDGGLTVFFSDISARKQVDAARKEHLSQLEALVQASSRLLAEDESEHVLQQALETAVRLTQAQVGRACWRGAGGALQTLIWPAGTAWGERFMGEGCFKMQQAGGDQPSLRLNAAELDQYPQLQEMLSGVEQSFNSILLARLLDRHGQTSGLVLLLAQAEMEFTAEDENLLLQLTNLASLRLQHLSAAGEAQRSADELERLMQVAPVPIAILEGENHLIRFANPAFQAVSHTPEVPVVGHTMAEMFPEGSLRSEYQMLGQVYRTGKAILLAEVQANIGADRHSSYWNVDLLPWSDASGEVKGVLIVSHEVTENMESRIRIQAERATLQAIIDAAPEGILVVNREGRLLLANPAAERMFAHPLPIGEEYFRDLDNFIADAQGNFLERSNRPLFRALSGEIITNAELSARLPDGSMLPLLEHAAPVKNQDGSLIGAIALFQDISPLKEAERQLRENEARLYYQARLLESVSDAIIATDRDLNITSWNRAAEELYGWKAQDVLGKPMHQVIMTEADGTERQHALTNLSSGKPYHQEQLHYHRDGRKMVINTTSMPVYDPEGSQIGYVSVNRDITQRRKAQTALEQSERNLRTILENLPVGIWLTDAQGQITYGNPTGLAVWGGVRYVGPNEFHEYRGWWADSGQPIQPDEWAVVRAVRDGEISLNEVIEIEAFDGQRKVILNSAVPIYDQESKIIGAVIVNEDISDLRQAQQALQNSETRYRSLFESLAEGLFLVEIIRNEQGKPVDFRFLDANPAVERVIGLKPANFIGKLASESFDEIDLIESAEFLAQVEQSGEPSYIEYFSEHYHKHFEIRSFSPLPGQVALLFMDVTERRSAEQAIRAYAEKLERSNQDLEDFAFIASHDLQEPLRKIQAFGSLLQERSDLTQNQMGQDYLIRMQDAAERMKRMLEDLLSYSRVNTQARPFEQVDLNQLVAEVLAELNWRIEKSGGRVVYETLPVIEGDRNQLRQMLMNLIANALKFHAPGQLPHVEIRAKRPDSAEQQGYFELEVTDSGIGFDPVYAEEIFQPFRRLHGRSEYEGSGIGLAICHKIAERHNGSIRAESQPNQGARFIVTLPFKQPRDDRFE